jgi:Bacterial membrane protein YfhO
MSAMLERDAVRQERTQEQTAAGPPAGETGAGLSPFTRRDAFLLLLLAGLIALFFWRILTPNPADRAQFPPGDFTDQFYAFRLYEARALAAGRLPLWSENINSGHPFLADVQAAVYYPIGLANTLVNVALYGPNFSLFALELEALLHFFLAGAFTYLFARRVIGERAGAFAAALVFTFGGYLTSYPSLQLAILETATWLPLALYFLDRAVPLNSPLIKGGHNGVGVANFLLAGIVLGIAALAGHPQTYLFVLATCVLYFGYRIWSRREVTPHGIRTPIGLFVLSLLIALGIAAAQWIPSLEYQQLSTREALAFREAGAGFPTLDLLQFIFPGFTSAFASPLYVGILPLWLACFALVRRGGRRVFWGLLAPAALILTFGFYVFGYTLLYLLPGGGLFREQERLAFIVSFALALLAGYGMNDLLAAGSNGLKQARKLLLLLPAGTAVSFALLIAFFAAAAQASSGRLAFLGDRAGLMLILFGLTSVLVGGYLGGRISRRVLPPLAIALILFDLFSVNEPSNKGAVSDPFPPNPLIEAVRRDPGVFRVADEQQLPRHFGIAYQLEEIGGISPLRLAHYDSLLALQQEKLLPLLNVKYLFTARSSLPDAKSLAQDAQTHLLRLDNTLPRAWLVGSAQAVPDDGPALERMETADFDPRQVALLANGAPFEPDPRSESGTVTIEAHEEERLSLTVNAPADGLLVVAENYYPGWVATVDGVPVEIIRADISLRAVPLRAGTHTVEFIFDPFSVKIGLAISVLTLVVCLADLLIVTRIFNRRRLVVEQYDAAN